MSSQVSSTETLPYLLDALLKSEPDATMLIDAITDRRITRAEFDAETRAWARRFAARGVRAGDTVAVMMGATFAAYNCWLGLSGLGAIEVPINPQLRGRSLVYLLNHSQAKVLVAHEAYLAPLVQAAAELSSLQTIVVPDMEGELQHDLPFEVIGAAAFRAREVEVDYHLAERHETACIIYTSGTTGPPKGVVIPWGGQGVVNNLCPDHVTGGTYYSFLSPAHMSGKGSLNNATMGKRALVLRETFSVREFWNDIRKYDCRVSQLFPQQIKYLLDAAPPSDDDRNVPLRYFWTAPLIPETLEFMKRFDLAVTTGFGMTEIGGPIAGIDIDGSNLKSCGTVNPDRRGYEVRLVDQHDREVPRGEVGEMIVRTSAPWTLNAGYYRNPEATATAWRNGWFHTGDAMRQDEDGNFYFVDRFKDCIRRKGENISSFELEAYATSYPGVAEAAAVGVPSAEGEEEVKIFVVAGDGGVDLDALGAWLIEQMPKFMVPRYLELVDEFPKTPATGRIQKSELRTKVSGPGEWDRAKSSLPAR